MHQQYRRGRWGVVLTLVLAALALAPPAFATPLTGGVVSHPSEDWARFAPPRRALSPQVQLTVPAAERSAAWQGTLLKSTAHGGLIGAALGGAVALMSRNGPSTGAFWRTVGLGTAAGALVGLGVGSVRMHVLRNKVEDQPLRTNRMVPEDVPGGFGLRYRLKW